MSEEEQLRQIIPSYASQLVSMYLFTLNQGNVHTLQQFQTADCRLFENGRACGLEDCAKFKKVMVREFIPAGVHHIQNEIDEHLALASFVVRATSEIDGREQPLTIRVDLRGAKYQQYYDFKIQGLWFLHGAGAE